MGKNVSLYLIGVNLIYTPHRACHCKGHFSVVSICTPLRPFKLNGHVNSSKKVRKLKFDRRFVSCYQLIFLAFGIIWKPCYSSLQWCAICYDYAIWGCAAHLNMGVGVKWNVPKCIAIVMTIARKMQGKWVGNKREIVSQTWVSELFLRSLFQCPFNVNMRPWWGSYFINTQVFFGWWKKNLCQERALWLLPRIHGRGGGEGG